MQRTIVLLDDGPRSELFAGYSPVSLSGKPLPTAHSLSSQCPWPDVPYCGRPGRAAVLLQRLQVRRLAEPVVDDLAELTGRQVLGVRESRDVGRDSAATLLAVALGASELDEIVRPGRDGRVDGRPLRRGGGRECGRGDGGSRRAARVADRPARDAGDKGEPDRDHYDQRLGGAGGPVATTSWQGRALPRRPRGSERQEIDLDRREAPPGRIDRLVVRVPGEERCEIAADYLRRRPP